MVEPGGLYMPDTQNQMYGHSEPLLRHGEPPFRMVEPSELYMPNTQNQVHGHSEPLLRHNRATVPDG